MGVFVAGASSPPLLSKEEGVGAVSEQEAAGRFVDMACLPRCHMSYEIYLYFAFLIGFFKGFFFFLMFSLVCLVVFELVIFAD